VVEAEGDVALTEEVNMMEKSTQHRMSIIGIGRIRSTLTIHGPFPWAFSEFDNQQVKPRTLGMEVWAENPPSNKVEPAFSNLRVS
jgi:hypothetical protein